MRFVGLILAAVFVLYPVFVYVGGRWLEPRYLGLTLLGLYLLRGILVTRSAGLRAALVAGSAVLAVVVWQFNSETLLLSVPALINGVMAIAFGYSLRNPPTLPARVARRLEGELTPEVERYTTQVTRLWLGFFCANGAMALVTAFCMSKEAWLLYNGVIAYILIGLLFAGEYAYRQLVVKKQKT